MKNGKSNNNIFNVSILYNLLIIFNHNHSMEKSNEKIHLLGLNLMHLLVENRLSEFHSQLELLTNVEKEQVYVSFPINLERYLMEGNYSKVLESRSALPSVYYSHFMDSLSETVRYNIR